MHLLKHIFYYVGLMQKNFSEKKPEKTLKEKKNKQNKTKQNKKQLCKIFVCDFVYCYRKCNICLINS